MPTSKSDVPSETDICEKCGCELGGEVAYIDHLDESWCHSCADNAAEAAYERQQESNLESPPESAREEQLRTWEEHQRLHGR